MKDPMKVSLKPQLQQKLAPQLIQSLQLLQLSTLELEQLVKQELEINPVLEEVGVTEQPKDDDQVELQPDEREKDNGTELDQTGWSEYLKLAFDSEYEDLQEEDRGREFVEKVPVERVTMADYLLSQLRLIPLSDKEYKIGEQIIGNINEDGYLGCSLEEITQSVGASVEEVKKVLEMVHTFDPPGIGARDLRESLMVQLRERGSENSLAMKIVEDRLEDLEKRRFSSIAKALGVKEQDVRKALEEIATLNPKPGWGMADEEVRAIVPDLIVESVGDGYVVLLNDKNSPTLRINPFYRFLLDESKGVPEETRKYIIDKLNSARWLIRAIQQRRSTLLAVMNYIVKAQHDFLEHGVSHLKPMVMQEVADALGMHISTISRVATNKYVQTPRGIFELKYFFDGRVDGKDGEDISAKSVKARIQQLIRNEDPENPLSDQQIADILNREGLSIARRTAAKYRYQLKILPARYRKKT